MFFFDFTENIKRLSIPRILFFVIPWDHKLFSQKSWFMEKLVNISWKLLPWTVISFSIYFCLPRNIIENFFHLFFRRYDEDEKAAWQCGSWCEYIFVVVFSSILLLASIVLTVFWIIYYKQGYSLEDKSKLFNFHPTLMIAGYITLSGFCKSQMMNFLFDFSLWYHISAVLLYRICRCCSHLIVKLCHVFFHACSIPCIVIGFLAVWESKNESNVPHFYSLHSWLGLITAGLFVFQFVLGFFR